MQIKKIRNADIELYIYEGLLSGKNIDHLLDLVPWGKLAKEDNLEELLSSKFGAAREYVILRWPSSLATQQIEKLLTDPDQRVRGAAQMVKLTRELEEFQQSELIKT